MQNILKITDFEFPTKLIADNDGQEARINSIITNYQKKYLRLILGDIEFYKMEFDNLTSLKWLNLINGVDYVCTGGFTVNFVGLKEILKKMIFKDIIDELNLSVNKDGYFVNNYENSKHVYPVYKIMNSWNDAINELGLNGENQILGTFYDYMKVNSSDFLDLNPNTSFFKKLNTFNI